MHKQLLILLTLAIIACDFSTNEQPKTVPQADIEGQWAWTSSIGGFNLDTLSLASGDSASDILISNNQLIYIADQDTLSLMIIDESTLIIDEDEVAYSLATDTLTIDFGFAEDGYVHKYIRLE